MMIELKYQGRRVLVNPSNIIYMDPAPKDATWIYFNTNIIRVDHTYEDIVKKIDATVGVLKLEEQITNFEDFKKE